MRFDATVRSLELMGEAASPIPDSIRQSAPQLPWRLVSATRNQLIEGYLGIDSDTRWRIIQTDIPALATALRALA